MFIAKVYYEGVEGGKIEILSYEVYVDDKLEYARKKCNRITKQGFRMGSWFIPAHRVVSVYLKESKNG